jgi:DMSO/TMAO reductase YedYZ molybdopterin-dependent catalytic subunit
MNAVRVPDERGFPVLVVAEDKWGYKWAKWVTEIELSTDPNYRGYWESRGYSNNGDQKGPSSNRRKKRELRRVWVLKPDDGAVRFLIPKSWRIA